MTEANERKKALDKILQQYKPLLEHVSKYVIYRDNLDSSWLKTIGSVCCIVNDVKLKGGKLNKEDYMKMLFRDNDVMYYYRYLRNFQGDNEKTHKYLSYKASWDDAVLLRNVYRNFINEVSSLFADNKKQSFPVRQFSQLFLQVYEKNVRV